MTKVSQLREAVSQLSLPERAELAAFLLGSLDDVHHGVSDDEVLKRREEMESGEVQGIRLAEFKTACGR